MKTVHPIAGALALVTILTFWVATVVSEVFGTAETVAAVKAAIPWGFLVLIPAIALAGGSGFALAKGRRGGLVDDKSRRMPIIAANGLLVLVPSALFLAGAAGRHQFDALFYGVQAVELVAGGVNLALLGLNMRDGLRMTRHRRRQPRTA